MWWLVFEALLALGLLVFIVWWTMFSGRPPRDDAIDNANDDDSAPR